MNLRTKILLMVSGGVLLIALIIVGIVRLGRKQERGEVPQSTVPISQEQNVFVQEGVRATPESRPAVLTPLALARTFAERYGSFSNQNNFSNIADVRLLVTSRLLGELEARVRTERAKSVVSASYSGITTTALNTKILKEKDDQMTVAVGTQRRETKGNAEPKLLTQTLEVSLLRANDQWLVDRATWK